MAKQPTFAAQIRIDESREARVRRIREEVQGGRYQVDDERLCLCIAARTAELIATSRRFMDARRAAC
ncbi:MAG: hypothetical protein NVSMB23_27020 [Myxococcales bacterium]